MRFGPTILIGLLFTALACAAPPSGTSRPLTSPASLPRLAILTERGIMVWHARQAKLLPDTRGIETISATTAHHCLIATRGHELLRVPLDGGAIACIYRHTSTVRFPAISPDGKLVAFCSAGDTDSDGRIWIGTLNVHDNLIDVAPITRRSGYGPSFSSDGAWLYFESDGLARIDLRTRAVEPFLPDFKGAYTVSCSPDGRFIAFSHERALYVYQTIDRSATKLTAGRDYDRFASFSRDQILFVRQSPDSSGKPIDTVCRVSVNGGDSEVLYQPDAKLVSVDSPDR